MTELMTDIDRLAGALTGAFPQMTKHDQHLALALLRALAEGEPVSHAALARAAGQSDADVEAALARWPNLVFYDDQGRIIGFSGRAIREMSHRFAIGGHDLWTWCAWDTLFLPELIGKEASVSSACPVTGEKITLTVGADGVRALSPPDAVVSFLLPDEEFDSNVVKSFCHFVHFFVSRQAGEQWTAKHDGTFLMSVEDAYELGRQANRAQFADVL
jgi:alkylmercury lyase